MKDEKSKGKFCLICGKKSDLDICEKCKDKVQAEAFYKKKKIEKEEKP
ncbi:MAG: hypothetical protein N2999_07320 [Proteobacteria bacterium]|nr:hypothetical protein [Pseudomonadota bacterium]